MGTITIARPSTGYLKERIPECERSEDPPHYFIREMELFLKELSRDGKIQPAKGSDQHEEEENREDVPSNARWTLIRQLIPLSKLDRICRLRIEGRTATEIENSACDSADATSLCKVSQRMFQRANQNAAHLIVPMRLFSGRIRSTITFELKKN
jgi:hypothetical protein